MFEFPDSVQEPGTIPDQFKGLYVTGEDGVATLDSTNPAIKGSIEAIKGQRVALAASRREATDYKGQRVDLSPLSEYGETPEGIHANITSKIEELTAELGKGSKAQIDVDKIRADLEKGFSTKAEALDARNKGLKDQLYDLTVTKAALEAIAAHKGESALLMPLIKTNVVVVEEEGQTNTYVTDGEGNRRYGDAGKPMTVAEFVVELKSKYPRGFESEANSGGGADGTAAAAAAAQRNLANKGEEKSPNEKISAGLDARKT